MLLASFGWICGFFLITASFYSLLDQKQQQQKLLYDNDGGYPSITIYAAPRPFSSDKLDLVRARQELAMRSWLALSPDVHVVLFGQHPSIVAFAGTLGPRVTVESDIDFTYVAMLSCTVSFFWFLGRGFSFFEFIDVIAGSP